MGVVGVVLGLGIDQAVDMDDEIAGVRLVDRGARVDVASHQYCYSFEPADHWSEYYCQHPELRAYFTRVLDERELRPHCRFETEVTGAVWDEDAARWRVTVETADGERRIERRGSVVRSEDFFDGENDVMTYAVTFDEPLSESYLGETL